MAFLNSELLKLVANKSSELLVNDKILLSNQDIYSFSSDVGKTINEINIYRTGLNNYLNWHFSNLSGGVAGISDYELNTIINNKKKKLNIYNKIIKDALWLLIYSTNESPASTGSFVKEQIRLSAERNLDLLVNSGFDNIWYYTSFSKPFAFRLHPIQKS